MSRLEASVLAVWKAGDFIKKAGLLSIKVSYLLGRFFIDLEGGAGEIM